jgi:hypothetical protein
MSLAEANAATPSSYHGAHNTVILEAELAWLRELGFRMSIAFGSLPPRWCMADLSLNSFKSFKRFRRPRDFIASL